MIVIPSKSDKESSLIVDAFRILAWQKYKRDHEVSGLEQYQVFNEEWKDYEIHNCSLEELKKKVTELGYSLPELKQIRQRYYETRD